MSNIPLAERMRPHDFEEFVGQEQLMGPDKILWRLIKKEYIPSLLLWGPPGTGKTTLARLLAKASKANFVFFSAVLSGVKDVRKIVDESKQLRDEKNINTILFVDEIHRFNKSQQDGFLPHVESGLLTLIGATTENPSFHVIAPLLSRCRVLVLNPLTDEHIIQIANRAINDQKNGFGKQNIIVEEDALYFLARAADGDARNALNGLEVAVSVAKTDENGNIIINSQDIAEAFQSRALRYDKDGEEHYNLISALHKSLRDSDPDGALYWLCRMLASGEDPLYTARRMIRFASEDIGNADPQALTIAINGRDSYHTLGTPEGELALAQVAVYLATAPKSNAVYTAYKNVMQDIKKTGSLPVPMHIRNAPTKLMKNLGYGKGYKYAHDFKGAVVEQDHLPDDLAGTTYYNPTNRGYEAIVKDRLTKWRQILNKKSQET